MPNEGREDLIPLIPEEKEPFPKGNLNSDRSKHDLTNRGKDLTTREAREALLNDKPLPASWPVNGESDGLPPSPEELEKRERAEKKLIEKIFSQKPMPVDRGSLRRTAREEELDQVAAEKQARNQQPMTEEEQIKAIRAIATQKPNLTREEEARSLLNRFGPEEHGLKPKPIIPGKGGLIPKPEPVNKPTHQKPKILRKIMGVFRPSRQA